MSKGVNKAIIVGYLTQDVETRYTASGSAIVNISVATNEEWKDKEGVKQSRPEYHRIVMFNKLAEIAAQYLKKGSQAYFEGRIQTRKWQDKDGNDRWSTEIVAHVMQMLGGGTRDGVEEKPAQAPVEAPAEDEFFDALPF